MLSSPYWSHKIVSDTNPSYVDELEDSIDDLGDFDPVPDTIFQLDDWVVSFLEEDNRVDEGEVDRMLSLVDQTEGEEVLVGRTAHNNST